MKFIGAAFLALALNSVNVIAAPVSSSSLVSTPAASGTVSPLPNGGTPSPSAIASERSHLSAPSGNSTANGGMASPSRMPLPSPSSSVSAITSSARGHSHQMITSTMIPPPSSSASSLSSNASLAGPSRDPLPPKPSAAGPASGTHASVSSIPSGSVIPQSTVNTFTREIRAAPSSSSSAPLVPPSGTPMSLDAPVSASASVPPPPNSSAEGIPASQCNNTLHRGPKDVPASAHNGSVPTGVPVPSQNNGTTSALQAVAPTASSSGVFSLTSSSAIPVSSASAAHI